MAHRALKTSRRRRRRTGIRKRVAGTPTRPRLCVYRSLQHIYAQLVDDLASTTLAAASTLETKAVAAKSSTLDAAQDVGRVIAQKAKVAGIQQVAFDRGGFRYHGRIKALADAARKEGLKF